MISSVFTLVRRNLAFLAVAFLSIRIVAAQDLPAC
jgi:hypothetical protein